MDEADKSGTELASCEQVQRQCWEGESTGTGEGPGGLVHGTGQGRHVAIENENIPVKKYNLKIILSKD